MSRFVAVRTYLTLAVIAFLATVTNAETITVCWDGSGDYLTIQEGIDAASNGDEVVVCDGTYTGTGNKNISFEGKAITVRSENGPENCIVDCQGTMRGFRFESGETTASVLEGFTITNGNEFGGGVMCRYESGATILNCITTCNTIIDDSGGGIYCDHGNMIISGCTIQGNSALAGGGGIACSYSTLVIADCIIANNHAPAGGGLICSFPDTLHITNCIFINNTADWGGAMCCLEYSHTILGCTITGNTAVYGGAGIFCRWTALIEITDCIITDNGTLLYGGGLYCEIDAFASLRRCTVGGNTAGWYGGGVYCYDRSRVNADSSVFSTNAAAYGAEIALEDNSSATLSYSNVHSDNMLFLSGGSHIVWEDGNSNADPLFVDPDGPDDDPNSWQDNDYHLGAGSPCIDGGDPDFMPQPGDRDMDGQWRVWDGEEDGDWRVDMGADEFGSHCPGDLDGDNDIDLGDLGGLLANYGTTSGMTPADGDSDLDGDVDLADLSALLAVYGTTCE